MKRVVLVILGFSILCGPFVTFAAENQEGKPSAKGASVEDMTDLKAIVVTATRYPEEVQNIPYNVTVISKGDIEKTGAADLPQLLKSEVGVVVCDWLGNSRNASIGIRGINMESATMNTVLMVDGRRLDDVDMTGYDWTDIPLSRIERIEIIRGSGSVLYGDNAVGGTINIITKKGEGNFGAQATVKYGSYQMHSEEASLGGAIEKFHYAFDGSYSYTDGYRANSYLRYKSAGTNLYYDFDIGSLTFSAGIKNDRYGQPGAIMESDLISGEYSRRDVEIDANTDNSIPYATTKSYYLKVTPAFYVGDTVTIKADITKEHKEPRSTNYWAITWPPPKTISNKADHEKDKIGVLPQVVVENKLGSSADNKLTFGYDKYVYDLTSHSNNWIYGTETLDAWYYQDIERNQYAYYIQDTLMLFDRVVLTGGYRYEKSTFTSDFEDNNTDYLSTRHSFDEEASEIGISYLLGRGLNVYYNYNKGFRYPKSDEFMSLTTGVVNEQLIPQQSEHHQLGVNYRFNNRLKVGLCLFQLDTIDEIYYDTEEYQNLNYNGKIRRDGVETNVRLQALDWLTFKGSYTRTEAVFESGKYDGNVFPGIPKHTYDLSTFIDFEYFSAWASLHGVSESYFISDWENRIQGKKRKLSGFTVLDVKASYKYGDFEIFAGINNVLDKEYEEYAVKGPNNDTWVYEPAYYPSPERNFFAGITYTY